MYSYPSLPNDGDKRNLTSFSVNQLKFDDSTARFQMPTWINTVESRKIKENWVGRCL